MKTNKNILPITVIIPCADDTRIKQCLESIDEKVEIVVVLNGATKEVRKIVKNYNVKIVEIPERNLAKSLNVGIENSRNTNVLFMDSDCIFYKGTIRKLYNGLQNYFFSKGRVVFMRSGFVGSIIAKARDYTTVDKKTAYKPPLAMKKDVKRLINNYYFDSDVHWTEDADLNMRVKEVGLDVNYLPSARILHPKLTLKQDLRSAFRYGIGKRIRVEKGKAKGIKSFILKTPDVLNKKGVAVAIYLIVWSIIYTVGYFYQLFFDPYDVRPFLIKEQ